MPSTPNKLLMGIYFYPRGGSAHVCRALARQFERNDFEVSVLSGSRSDLDEHTEAASFYSGLDLRAVDFAPALRSGDPLHFEGPAGTAPIQGSYEDRHEAEDPVLAAIGDEAFELQVEAWERELASAGAGDADLLYLHHLTPLNEAAARAFPELPVLGHVHGTELLMLERIAAGAPAGWAYADAWAERIRSWAAACQRIVVSDPKGLERASGLLEVDPDRFACVPNGFDTGFAPGAIDRRAHWRRHLVERPRGWRPGSPPGSVAYAEADLAALEGTVLLYAGRFTAVKRLPLLIEAYARARRRFGKPTALVLLGGHVGEWEGEHPIETIERLGCPDVFLAGWHSHADLPDFLRASDLLVHASVHEQFGQVLVEAMACGLPVIAVDRGGPSAIVDDPQTGWLVPPDDPAPLADAMVAAVDDAPDRRRRGERARDEVIDRYAWGQIGRELAELARACTAPVAASGA
ncbi:MAG TPA: glycosyltransferase family 4 protein [Solirubrobacterales bacterium]|jgi:glycosyltransferase involved in cell wall biosynthesis|nr:glycosyltransferase family 4 protein [Solirubrobacterales bacterium]